MGAIIGSALTVLTLKIGEFFTSKVGKTVLFASVFTALYVFLPVSISLPSSIYNALISDNVIMLLNTISLLLPVNFILTCFVFILLCRNLEILYSIFTVLSQLIVKALIS